MFEVGTSEVPMQFRPNCGLRPLVRASVRPKAIWTDLHSAGGRRQAAGGAVAFSRSAAVAAVPPFGLLP